MPSTLVKNERDEKMWARAKRLVHKQYPDVKPGTDRYYALVVTIFKKLKGGD